MKTLANLFLAALVVLLSVTNVDAFHRRHARRCGGATVSRTVVRTSGPACATCAPAPAKK